MFAGVAGDVARNNIDYDVIYSSTHLQIFYQVLYIVFGCAIIMTSGFFSSAINKAQFI